MPGVATSISALRQYDLNDTIEFLKSHEQFDSLQVFLNQKLLSEPVKLIDSLNNIKNLRNIDVYFHLDYSCGTFLNENKDYIEQCKQVALRVHNSGFIFHFDSNIPLTRYAFIFELFENSGVQTIWIENYYDHHSPFDPLFQNDSYKSLFALYKNRFPLGAVLDIPRLFHTGLNLKQDAALRETCGIMGFFKSQHIPQLLHLIDVTDSRQSRNHFCALGTGIIPYSAIFDYIKEHQIKISDIILEYEDKIKPIDSITYLKRLKLI